MFRGSMVALVTPLINGNVDVEKLRALVEWHISEGSHALVVTGSTGEAGTLSVEEKLQVIRIVVETAKENIPVIACTALNATKDCAAFTLEAMECGVDAALITTPCYIKPTQEGLLEHFHYIAKEVAIPIILYNVPSRTACDMLPETVARLSRLSNIIGIKEASGNMERLKALLSACEHDFDVFSGDDATAAAWMVEGAKGVISVAANVVPRMMAKLCDYALDKEVEACKDVNEKLSTLYDVLSLESNPIPVKWALHKMQRIENELRLPLLSLQSKNQPALEEALANLSLL